MKKWMVAAIAVLALLPFVTPQNQRSVTPCECAKEQVLQGLGKKFDEDFAKRCNFHLEHFADVKFFEEFEQCLFDLYADVFPELKSEQLEEEPTSDDSTDE